MSMINKEINDFSVQAYQNGEFTVESMADMSYVEKGKLMIGVEV